MFWTMLLVALSVSWGWASESKDLFATRPKVQQPLGFREAVALALRESPVLRGAAAELKAAIARTQQIRAETRPQLSLNAFASTGTQTGIVTPSPVVMPSPMVALPPRSSVTTNAMLMLPLATGGRLPALVRQAEALQRATAAQLEAMRLEVALETKLAYLKALLSQEMVRVAQAYVTAMEERLRIDKVAAEVGRIPEFWVLRSEAELANARQLLINAQRDYEIALTELKAVMGVHPDSQIVLAETLASVASSLFGLKGVDQPTEKDSDIIKALEPLWDRQRWLTEALTHRPELRNAKEQWRAQREGVRVAKAAFAPQVSLMAMAERMNAKGEMSSGGYLISFVVGWTLLDGGQRKGMVAEALAMSEKAQADVERIQLQIVQEVDIALQQLRAAAQNLSTARAALSAAEEDARVAKVRYEAGRSVLVEYLDALSALVRAQLNFAQALYDLTVAYSQLERASGRL